MNPNPDGEGTEKSFSNTEVVRLCVELLMVSSEVTEVGDRLEGE